MQVPIPVLCVPDCADASGRITDVGLDVLVEVGPLLLAAPPHYKNKV